MSNRLVCLIAGTLLSLTLFLAVFSIKDDSFTFDETAHIAAGYSYLTQKDYRLNPEHPPLIKDLAGLPLLFLNLNFPKDDPSWIQKELPQWWVQFDFGTQFLYRSGNNPDKILFWARLPMILVLIFLGWFLFFWTKRLFGKEAGLLALFFFSLSPTFLAHGRLITTDVGAALGTVLATYFWINFLKNPKALNVVFAGFAFGLAMLIKFSLILLIPFFVLITLVYALIYAERKPLFNFLKYLVLALLTGIIGMVFIVWPVYFYHTYNFPPEQQLRDTQFLLSTTSISKSLADLNVWMVRNPVLRPFGQYFLGLFLATNRSTTGNTTYFLGQISATGWKTYFPVVYSIKEPLPFHVLTLIALLYLAWLTKLTKKPFWQEIGKRIILWIKSHFAEFSMLCFIAIYWITSLTAKLNIGVRHLLPVFPFTFILVSAVIINLLKNSASKVNYISRAGLSDPRPATKGNTPLESSFFGKPNWTKGQGFPEKLKYGLLAILLLWQIISVVAVFPHFLAYFNELAGGPDKGYIFVVDSNLDWGQDLKRLKNWMDAQGVDKIYIDYFGGGNLDYYLPNRHQNWWGRRNPSELPERSYLAVSANQLQGGRAEPAKGYDQPSDFYRWLDKYTPVTKIGYSIFVYYIK